MTTMPLTPESLAELRDKLDADPSSIKWIERKRLGEQLRPHIEAGEAGADALGLLNVLARDPKAEVRQAVANLLPLLPDATYQRLHEMLKDDCHAAVLTSVQRAARRRERATKRDGKVIYSTERLTGKLNVIEQRYGSGAAQAALEVGEAYLQEVSKSMLHDLRSIVTSLHSRVPAAIEAEPKDRPKRARRVTATLAALKRLLVDMERFTQPLNGRRKQVPLTHLVSEAITTAADAVREDGQVDPDAVAVELDIPDGASIKVNEHLIVVALTNFLKNAFEAFAARPDASAPPRIRITAVARGEGVEIAIADNGIGMEQEQADRLLKSAPGRRNKSKRRSTGYGFANALRNIASHDGTVALESNESVGTTVHIVLPRPQQTARRRQ